MIKFVYFDVGGVLIKDFSKTNKWEELRVQKNISEENFFELRRKLSEGQIDIIKTSLTLNDFVSKYEFNKFIWPVVRKIKEKLKVGLLTNQYNGLLTAIIDADLMPHVDWDVIVDSSVEGVSKPNEAIFKLAESKCGYSGNEILFVDNREKYVLAALI